MTATRGLAIELTEQGLVPDAVIRHGIRRLVRQRLAEIDAADTEAMARHQRAFVQHMRGAEVAPLPERANEQHYEVPAMFFEKVLGPRMKYSCAWWPEGVRSLGDAENAALRTTCERAGLHDGQRILELGCGWGSLTLWMARHYPASRITAVSNSWSQAEHIRAAARDQGLGNVSVITQDMNEFEAEPACYDRIVSVEMFEHMRNWPALFARVAGWLRDDGLFFMHVFAHRAVPYAFDDKDASDWMSRYFFSGGMMPSDDLPLWFQDQLVLRNRWRWDGRHYEKTANAWLANMDRHREALWPHFEQIYGRDFAQTWWARWRMFFMACAELFGHAQGQEWGVSHYLFGKRS